MAVRSGCSSADLHSMMRSVEVMTVAMWLLAIHS